jgi:hypothetical protein
MPAVGIRRAGCHLSVSTGGPAFPTVAFGMSRTYLRSVSGATVDYGVVDDPAVAAYDGADQSSGAGVASTTGTGPWHRSNACPRDQHATCERCVALRRAFRK